MPQTKVKAPDGTIVTVQHPEGATEQEIIAYAQQNHAAPAPAAAETAPPSWIDRNLPSLNTPQSAYGGFGAEAAGLAEKAANVGASTVLLIPAGLNAAAHMLPGGKDPSQAFSDVMGMAYQPRTEAGKRPTIVGDVMGLLPKFADWAGGKTSELLGPSFGPPVGAALKAGIETAPLLYGARGAIGNVVGDIAKGNVIPTLRTPTPIASKPTPEDTMGLSSETITDAGDKLVNNTFRGFREKMGDDTPVPMTKTLDAAKTALEELAKQGKSQSSIARELRQISGKNSETKETTVAILDDIAGNMIRNKMNPKGTGPRQAQAVIDAVIEDLDAAGKVKGLNFGEDIATARAFGDLYKAKNLGRVVGQHGETLAKYEAANPAGYREVIQDWTAKKVGQFVNTNVSGGRGFNTGKFAEWVDANADYLTKIVGPDTVNVWQAFPKWEGRIGWIKSLAQKALSAKTGGLSNMFNKQIDSQFADSIAEQLTNPNSALFRQLTPKPAGSSVSKPALALEGTIEQRDQKQRR
jgi:hypothetical protein